MKRLKSRSWQITACRCLMLLACFNRVFVTLPCFEDLNECRSGLDSCLQSEECINTYGSYQCVCRSGYTRDSRGFCVGMEVAMIITKLLF